MDKIVEASISSVAEALRKRQVSCLEVVSAYVEEARRVNVVLGALVYDSLDAALRAAMSADARLAAGVVDGPLHGIPFTVKDTLEVKGMIATAGTLGRREYRSYRDAAAVNRLRLAGGIVLGKTNVSELAFFFETDNLVYGRTNNPYNSALSSGGSSGGEAALISARGSPLGIGSDLGGSVRQPAHLCGIAALRPSPGRFPRGGHFPYFGRSLDALWQVGLLAKRVDDLISACPAMMAEDGQGLEKSQSWCESVRTTKVSALRVASLIGDDTCSPEIERCVQDAVAAIGSRRPTSAIGASRITSEAYRLFRDVIRIDGARELEQALHSARTMKLHPWTETALERLRSRAANEAERDSIMLRWESFRGAVAAALVEFDVVVTPVSSRVAFAHGWSMTRNAAEAFAFTMAFSLAGWPSVVVRAGTGSTGLPIGVQIASKPGCDEIALGAALAVERTLGGWAAPKIGER